MSATPKGLGEAPKQQQFRLLRETVELPPTRKDLVQRFEMIVAQGGVQRVLVQLGRPIEVDRFVPASEEMPELEEQPSDDLLDQVRNGELKHLDVAEDEGALSALFFAFQMLSEAKAAPVALYVSSGKSLSSWLKLKGARVDKVFGVEVRESKEIPEDAAILAGVTDDAAVGVRVPVPEFQKATAVTVRTKKPQGVLK